VPRMYYARSFWPSEVRDVADADVGRYEAAGWVTLTSGQNPPPRPSTGGGGGGGDIAVPAGATLLLATDNEAVADANPDYTWVILEPIPEPPATTSLTDISGLVFYYDAAALALTDGATVTTLADQSGNGRNATAVLGSATYRTAGVNGKPSLQFAGNAYFNTATFPALTGTVTVLAAIELAGTGSANLLDGTAYGNQITLRRSGTGVRWGVGRNTLGYAPDNSGANGTYLLRATIGVGANPTTLHVDGTQLVNSANLGSAVPTALRVGGDPDGNARFTGHLVSLAVFDRALTADEAAAAEGILNAKLGR
jgi:hypothetical protein